MLEELSSVEITEWKAYLAVKERREKENQPKNTGKANKNATLS